MKNRRKRGLSGTGEFLVIAALLSVYAIVIFMSPDPEWVVWAGQMTMGVIDPSAAPPASAGAVEALHTASALSTLGILAAAVLVAAAFGAHPGRLSRLHEHAVAGHSPGKHGAEPPV